MRFVWVVMNEGFTNLMVLIENNTGTTNDVLFKQHIDIFILLVKEMKLCCRIGDGIETDSHGDTRKRNSLMHKVNVFLFVKFINVFIA